jgi:hypothetical protein
LFQAHSGFFHVAGDRLHNDRILSLRRAPGATFSGKLRPPCRWRDPAGRLPRYPGKEQKRLSHRHPRRPTVA